MSWVTTIDPAREVWRRLLEYTNHDIALARVEALHGSNKKHAANRKKQVEQIRACLLQAREYFSAAESSGLVTSPNHIYYGLVSLTSAVMLTLGTGTRSLDYLRNDKANRNHGLDFTLGGAAVTTAHGYDFLQCARVEILERGHFQSWYTTLPSAVVLFGKATRPDGEVSATVRTNIGLEAVPAFGQLAGSKCTLLELLLRLPDLFLDAARYGQPAIGARGAIGATHDVDGNLQSMSWTIHAATSKAALEAVLDGFRCNPNLCHRWSVRGSQTRNAAVVEFDFRGMTEPGLNWPTMRESLTHELIFYPFEVSTPELVDVFMASYALSNLARYFPDLWVAFLESHSRAAKLVESFVTTQLLKAPLLCLRFLTSEELVLSTRPWN